MQVLCCGTRRWNDPYLIRKWLEGLKVLDHLQITEHPVTILVGDNREKQPKGIIGADFFIAEIAYQLDYQVLVFPALWQTWGRAAGPIRNKQMLDRKPDLVLAFRCDGESFGTDNVLDTAVEMGIPAICIHSDGSHENLKHPEPIEQIEMFPGAAAPTPRAIPDWLREIEEGSFGSV